MSFISKFKTKNDNPPPPGVNLEYSSFGVEKTQNTYNPPPI